MTLNIDSIQNPTLKRAAEIADSSGETAFDNNLDQSELSVFIKSAYQNNVSTEEIMEVVNQVGIPQKEGDEAQQTVAKLQRLEKLEKELTERKETRKEIVNSKEETRRTILSGGIGGAVAGVLSFLKLKQPYMYQPSSEFYTVTKILPNKIALPIAVASAVAVGVLAGFLSEKIGTTEKTRYTDNAVEPLKNEIKELKQEMLNY